MPDTVPLRLSGGGSIKYRDGPLTLSMHNTDHPMIRNLDQLQRYEQGYRKLAGEVQDVSLLASSVEEGKSRAQVGAYHKDAGRVFVSIPGCYSGIFEDPPFRVLSLGRPDSRSIDSTNSFRSVLEWPDDVFDVLKRGP